MKRLDDGQHPEATAMKGESNNLKAYSGRYNFDLPIAPAWFSDAPKGSMEDGIRLSLAALEQVKDRPEIFEERAKRMVAVEFVLQESGARPQSIHCELHCFAA